MEIYADEIQTEELKEHLYLLSSDVLEGRKTGEKGQKMALNYLTAYYIRSIKILIWRKII